MQCIICREDKKEMSDEHVIPDSLSGYYHIYNVCRECNSKLGKLVDSPLVNHKLSDFYRFSKDIKGKSGKIPNPFSGITFQNKEDPDLKARVDVEDNGNLKLKYHPLVKLKEHDGVVESIEIEVDSDNEKEIDKLLKKIIDRKGIPESDVIKSEFRREVRTGGVGGKWEIDTLKFKIGLLKIAYEFAIDCIPKYFDDEKAKEISKILNNANYEGVNEYAMIGNGLDTKILQPFEGYLDFESENHYLILTESNYGLTCIVKLHGLFCVGIVLSNKKYLKEQESIIGINNVTDRIFKKYQLIDIIKNCLDKKHFFRFAYEIRSQTEVNELNSPNYKYVEYGNGNIPIYNKNGNKYPFLAHELMENSHVEFNSDGSSVIATYYFDENNNYFVKSANTGKLYQVTAAQLTKKIIRKI